MGTKLIPGWLPKSCTTRQKSDSDTWAKKLSNRGVENYTAASPSQVSRSLAIERGGTQGIRMGQRVKLEDGGSAASCQGGLRGTKELGKKTTWLLSQRHGGNTALQSVSIVMNWHFLIGGGESTRPGSSFVTSTASTHWSQGVFEKPLAFSGVQNQISEPRFRLSLSHPSWLLFSFPSDGSAANLVAPTPPSIVSGLLHIRHPQSASFLDLGRCKAWRSFSLRCCRQEALFSSLSFLLLFRSQENKSFCFPSPLLLHRDIHSLRHLKGCWKGRGWPFLPIQGELEKILYLALPALLLLDF